MKIIFPIEFFYPAEIGGPGNSVYWLSKALVNKNIDVSVIASHKEIKKNIDFNKWILLDKIRVRYCVIKNKLPLNSIVWHTIRETKKNDIVILSSICFLSNFFVFFYSKINRNKIVWSPRGELFNSAINNNRYKVLYFKFLNFLIGKEVVFHATSKEEEKTIKTFFPNKPIIVIPNYMELPRKFNRNENTNPYLLFIGRIAPIKALDKLIIGLSYSKAFIESDFIFKIVGPVIEQYNDYYERLNQIIIDNNLSQKVVIEDSIFEDEKYQYYADAYFTFLVSDSENFGNVVIESISQGTPVIASEGTPWQVLNDYKAGFWINNNSKNISNYIDKILSLSKKEYFKMRDNAYNLSKTFDINENVYEWIKYLEKMQ